MANILSLVVRFTCKHRGTSTSLFGKFQSKDMLWTRWLRSIHHGSDRESMSKVRNIGIMAHIDAGKTTTTERMLFYSGVSKRLGDVDHGDTVMDYMEQERERGITITSAATTLHWDSHKINLIDTPGHVDFTVEVERSLRVLDGAVAVLDASAGVEAQTLTVWRQADRYHVPRLVYLNKMDKPGASLPLCLESLQEKLHATPLPLQIPIGTGAEFVGVVDLLAMTKLLWQPGRKDQGTAFREVPLTPEDGELLEEAQAARHLLLSQLADLDEHIADLVLADVKLDEISSTDVAAALRRVTLERTGVPVLCGSSLKNKGVQPLLDSVVAYLPSPVDVNYGFAEFYGTDLCALAFKVIHDKQRGPLTFLRLYSGSLGKGESVYNINRRCPEKATRVLHVCADEFQDTHLAAAGNIVCVSGFKETFTGDTLTNSSKTARAAMEAYLLARGKKAAPAESSVSESEDSEGSDSDEEEAAAVTQPVLAGLKVPQPVFFCGVEPPSLSAWKSLETALQCLQKEDPSLQVEFGEDQIILRGMGELHLEVVLERLRRDWKVEASLGPLQINYREMPAVEAQVEEVLDSTIGERSHHVTMTMSVHPNEARQDFSHLEVESRRDAPLELRRGHLKAIQAGVVSALNCGPVLGFPVSHCDVTLHKYQHSPGVSMAIVSACASQSVRKALTEAQTTLLEPVMAMEIITDEDRLSAVLGDLSRRRGQIINIQNRHNTRTLQAATPLAELVGYSTALRTITSGTATVTMEISHYRRMEPQEQAEAISRATGVD